MIINTHYVIYNPEYKKYVYYASNRWIGITVGISYSNSPKASGIKTSSDELLIKFHKVIDNHINYLKNEKPQHATGKREIEHLQRLKANFQIHRLTTEVYTPDV